MFILLLAALLVAATVHSMRLNPRTAAATGELFLRYILVGYCGLPMIAVSLGILAFPGSMAEMLPVGPPTAVLAFFGWAYLGMSLAATLALWYRGAYLIGPALSWAVYFAGATVVHLHGPGASAHLSHGGLLLTFATHGMIALVLGGALLASGLLKRRAGS